VEDPEGWLLTADERGNSATALPAWTSGNLCVPLVHGATYFDRLVEEVEALKAGDHLFFADWQGDADERLREGGPTVAALFGDALRRGVCVRGLVWRSHTQRMSFTKKENRKLDEAIEDAGGQVILDQRVRRGGSHHQKFVVLRHADDPSRAGSTCATAGGTTPSTAVTRSRRAWPRSTGRTCPGTTCS
jgi:hypothetical protein